jgi:hypothetical protein
VTLERCTLISNTFDLVRPNKKYDCGIQLQHVCQQVYSVILAVYRRILEFQHMSGMYINCNVFGLNYDTSCLNRCEVFKKYLG